MLRTEKDPPFLARQPISDVWLYLGPKEYPPLWDGGPDRVVAEPANSVLLFANSTEVAECHSQIGAGIGVLVMVLCLLMQV